MSGMSEKQKKEFDKLKEQVERNKASIGVLADKWITLNNKIEDVIRSMQNTIEALEKVKT